MSTMPSCPALIYIENGALPFAQMVLRPLSMLAGRSYTSAGEFHPSLIKKIAAIALTIIFLPLAIPAIGLSFLALSLSSSHKEQCAALFVSPSPPPLFPSAQIHPNTLVKAFTDPAKEQEELENSKRDACAFIDEMSTLRFLPTPLPVAVTEARTTIKTATTFTAILQAFQRLQDLIRKYILENSAFRFYIDKIQFKAAKEEMKEIVNAILNQNANSAPSQHGIDITASCLYLLIRENLEVSEIRDRLTSIASKYKAVFGCEHEVLKSHLSRYVLSISLA